MFLILPIILIVLFLVGYTGTFHGDHKGTKYSYWQTHGCCRELTLEQPDGSVVILYDEDNNNVIGNDKKDYYMIQKDGMTLKYTKNHTLIPNGWNDEVMKTDEALEYATQLFQEWRERIKSDHPSIGN
jgi:hypothetical protein